MADRHPSDPAYDALGVSRLMGTLLKRDDFNGINPHDVAYMFDHIAQLAGEAVDGIERTAAAKPKP